MRRCKIFAIGEHYALQSKQLGERPSLKGTAARRVRVLCIGDLGNMAEAGMIQVFYQRRKKTRARLAPGVFGSVPNAQPSFDERAD